MDETIHLHKRFWLVKGIMLICIFIIFLCAIGFVWGYRYNKGKADQREETLQTFLPMQLQYNNQAYCWIPGGGVIEIEQTKGPLWRPITRSRK